ncbi:MAG: hypothetical protein ABL928_13800 [Sphingorhabdus sp.]
MTDSPSINDTNHTVPDDLKTVETGSSLRDAPVNDGITTPAPFARSNFL